MKKCISFSLLLFLLLAPPSKAGILEEIWERYTSSIPAANSPQSTALAKAVAGDPLLAHPLLKEQVPITDRKAFLGRKVGNFSEEEQSLFFIPWKYRAITYELHFEDRTDLASMLYGLALHSGDIDTSLSREKFAKAVLGFHYSLEQVCAWLNDAWLGKSIALTSKEYTLLGLLLQDGIIVFADRQFVPTGLASHVLGASAGKKKTLQEVLVHERLHVFWDEDLEFRTHSQKQWESLSADEKAAERKKLHRYAKDNEAQLIEEWAVHGQ